MTESVRDLPTAEPADPPEPVGPPEASRAAEESGRDARRAWLDRLPFVAGLLLLSVGLIQAVLSKTFSSDDVNLQVILKSAGLGDGHKMYVAPDNFVIKFPLYWLMNRIDYGSRTSLSVTVYLLAIAGYALYLLAGYRLLSDSGAAPHRDGQRRAGLAALVWPATLGTSFLGLLNNPNLRNIEVGIAFGCLALTAGYLDRRQPLSLNWKTVTAGVVGAVLLGLYFYNDPYFEYVFFAPLVALCAVSWLKDRTRRAYLMVVGFVAAAVVAAAGWRAVLRTAGLVVQPTNTNFSYLSEVPGKALMAVQGLVGIFDTDFFGKPSTSPSTLVRFLYLAPVVLLFLAHRNEGVRRSLRESFVHRFLVVQICATLLLYLLSRNTTDVFAARYLVAVPFSAALLAAIVVARHSAGAQATRVAILTVTALALASLCQNGAALSRVATRSDVVASSDNISNAVNRRIATMVHDRGLTKGYADYWDADINTYFSRNETQFLPVMCGAGNRLMPYYWMMDGYWLDRPADRTFFVYDPKGSGPSATDESCGAPAQLARQFGEPSEVVPVVGDIQLFIYDRDLW
jgi:hypothetical protein